jgi:hypothetical protein
MSTISYFSINNSLLYYHFRLIPEPYTGHWINHYFIMITPILVWPLLASIAVAAPQGNSLRPTRTSLIVSRGVQNHEKTGSAAAVWNNNVELLTQVNVAGKNYSVVLDTGSADM